MIVKKGYHIIDLDFGLGDVQCSMKNIFIVLFKVCESASSAIWIQQLSLQNIKN